MVSYQLFKKVITDLLRALRILSKHPLMFLLSARNLLLKSFFLKSKILFVSILFMPRPRVCSFLRTVRGSSSLEGVLL